MKKLFTLIAAVLMTVGAWADSAVYSPVLEYNTRPNTDGSSWKALNAADADHQTFECTASANFYAIQQYTVADLANATKLTLSLKGGSSNGTDALAIWAFDGTFTSDMTAEDFNSAFAATTGIAPGAAGTSTADNLLKDKSNTKTTMDDGTNRECTFVISGTALTTLKGKADANGTITLLITNNVSTLESFGTSNRKYYSSSNETESLRPTLTAEVEIPACTIDGVGYSTLADAIAACPTVTEDANVPTVITVNKDVEIGARVNVQSQNITIKGATGAEKILRKSSYTNGLLFLTKDTLATLTIQNIIIDGQSVEATSAVFESSNKGLTVLNNVTIQNATCTTGTQGIFCNKSKGRATLNGVKMTNCSAPASKALVFVGTNLITLAGTNDFGAIYVEKQNYITNDNAQGVQEIIVDADRTEGDLVLNGLVENYTVTGTTLPVNQNGKNVYLGEVVVETPNCQIGTVGYNTLAEAVAACPTVTADANEPTVITVNKDLEISARINVQSQNITIKSATGAEKLLRKESYTNGLLFLTKDTLATLTLEDITVDGQSVEATSAVFEASNKGTTVLNNVTIQNATCTTGTQGLFCNKNAGNAVLNGVKMTNCSAPASKALVFVGTSRVTLMGENNFGPIYVEKTNYFTNEDAEGVQAIIVDADRETGLVLVKNGLVENYTVSGTDLQLVQDGADVCLGTPSGISNVNVSNNSVVYNVAGQRVNANAKGIVIINGKKVIR